MSMSKLLDHCAVLKLCHKLYYRALSVWVYYVLKFLLLDRVYIYNTGISMSAILYILM